mgnify:CR=1 FL=1
MKIIVPVKRVLDPNVKVRVKSESNCVETENVKMALNPFCEIAVEEAIRLKEKGVADEVIAVSIGEAACQEQLRTALALGVDRAILITTEVALEPLAVAKVLNQVVVDEQPGMVILGKQSVDSDNNQTGQMLAALTSWPQATFASQIDVLENKVSVTREVDGGLQVCELDLPAIVTTDLRLNTPRFASLPNIMKAKRKPLDTKNVADFGININPRLNIIDVKAPPERKAGIKVNSVNELIEKLKNDEIVL